MPSNNTHNTLAMAGIAFASCVFLMVFTKICKYICCSRRSGEGGGFGETLREGNNFVVSAASSGDSSTGGLNPTAVTTLPIVSYRRDLADDNARGGGWAQCAVCLDLVKEEEMVRQLPKCKHLFHVECIDMWLYSHSTCPLCRATVEPVGETKEEEKMEAHAGLPPV